MFRIRLLTFCTVPHAAQFAPTICANLRWQPLQLLIVGPDAISLILSGGMSTISKLLEADAVFPYRVAKGELSGAKGGNDRCHAWDRHLIGQPLYGRLTTGLIHAPSSLTPNLMLAHCFSPSFLRTPYIH